MAPTQAEQQAQDDMENDQLQQDEDDLEGYASSSPPSSTQTSTLTWITWFTSLPGHEYFCEVAEEFIEDDFNLTGLQAQIPFWKEALEMVLDVEPEEDSLKIPDVSIVESSAELLYGLVHQRYILTRQGLQAMASKQFGCCPRFYCHATAVVPGGRSDLPGLDTVKLYCPNCGDIYSPPSSRFQGVDGAFFGTTFPHLFFQTYRELFPAPFCPPSTSSSSTTVARTGSSAAASSSTISLQAESATAVGGAASTVPAFRNPDPYGGQKAPFGEVYAKRIYGFRVSERARSGPRMAWLRMRPTAPEELDKVDWRGRWIGGGPGEDGDEDEEGGEGGRGEAGDLFDGDKDDVEDGEGSESEEEDAPVAPSGPMKKVAASIPTTGVAGRQQPVAAVEDSDSEEDSALDTPVPFPSSANAMLRARRVNQKSKAATAPSRWVLRDPATTVAAEGGGGLEAVRMVI